VANSRSTVKVAPTGAGPYETILVSTNGSAFVPLVSGTARDSTHSPRNSRRKRALLIRTPSSITGFG
jgi:hypothetical protein